MSRARPKGYQRGLKREVLQDRRKYEVGRLLTFRRHLPDSIAFACFKRGDVLRVTHRCTNGVQGGIDVVRVADRARDFVFPEEVTVRRRA